MRLHVLSALINGSWEYGKVSISYPPTPSFFQKQTSFSAKTNKQTNPPLPTDLIVTIYMRNNYKSTKWISGKLSAMNRELQNSGLMQ